MAFEAWMTDDMAKRHKPEEIITKLRQVDVLVSQGSSVADAVRGIAVTEVGLGLTRFRGRSVDLGRLRDQSGSLVMVGSIFRSRRGIGSRGLNAGDAGCRSLRCR